MSDNAIRTMKTDHPLTKQNAVDAVKAQTVLHGYYAWAFLNLLKRSRQKEGQVVRQMLHEWIDSRQAELSEWALTKADYARSIGEAEIIPFADRRSEKD